MRKKKITPRKTALFSAALLLFIVLGGLVIGISGRSHRGPLPPPTAGEADLASRLASHVGELAGRIGERNLWRPEALERAARYLEEGLRGLGLAVTAQEYVVEGRVVRNLVGELPGGSRAGEIVVIGAHYDSVIGSPGANDNASGVAALLETARLLRDLSPARTLRFVAFVNEEPPFFQTERMGSYRYARRASQQGENIVAMVSLETIGCFRDEPGSQGYPTPLLKFFYPDRGDFIAFVANFASHRLLRRGLAAFRARAAIPSRGLAGPAWLAGVDWSDQWAFWEQGYPAMMVTDTALYRYPWYHTGADTPEKLDYQRMARVVAGLAGMTEELANR